MAGIDIVNIESGNPIYNGSIIMNPGVHGKSYFEYYREESTNKPVISDIETKYSGDFDEITYYTLGS
jgi:hypothetical protein